MFWGTFHLWKAEEELQLIVEELLCIVGSYGFSFRNKILKSFHCRNYGACEACFSDGTEIGHCYPFNEAREANIASDFMASFKLIFMRLTT